VPRSSRLRRLVLDRAASRAEKKAAASKAAPAAGDSADPPEKPASSHPKRAAAYVAALVAQVLATLEPPLHAHPTPYSIAVANESTLRPLSLACVSCNKGKLDLLRPRTHDPERWVPKKLRASNLRRLKRSHAKGASSGPLQGSGAQGVGADGKDAAKLDAYARAQQKKADAEAAEAKAQAAAESGKRGPYRRLK